MHWDGLGGGWGFWRIIFEVSPGCRGDSGLNILASIESGSLRRVCLVVTNFFPPTLRVTTLFRDMGEA